MLFSGSEVQTPSVPAQDCTQLSQTYSVTDAMNSGSTANQVSSNETSTKPKVESLPFSYQFSEVEKAIANFTKHQPFNHHYAPNVNVNRNHNHHHHNNNNNNNSNHNGSNRFNNYNNNNNGRYHQKQQQFSMNAQLKQQQHQHFVNSNVQLNRYKQMNNNGLQHHHQQHQQHQHQQQIQPQPQQQNSALLQQQYHQYQSQHTGVASYQQPSQHNSVQGLSLNTSGMMNNGNDLKFDSFQSVQQPQFSHSDLMNPIRNTSPTFTSPVRSGSNGFVSSLEQMNSPSSASFSLNNSDFLNTPLTNVSSSGDLIDKSLSLGDSGSYLGDIWGNSKSASRNSASVWA